MSHLSLLHLCLLLWTSLVFGCGPSADSSPGKNAALVSRGRSLHTTYACDSCHSLDGSPRSGPSYVGNFGDSVALVDGRKLVRDEAYLRRALVDPNAEIPAGSDASMPTYRLSADQLDALVAFMKSLTAD